MSKSNLKRKRVQIDFTGDPGLTHQSFKDTCCIQNIMKQYRRTGIINHLTSAKEILGDFTEVPDFQEALNIVIRAQEAFDTVPAPIRARFENDPGKFIDFCSNPSNLDEMINLGLANKPIPVPEPLKTDVQTSATHMST